MDSRLRTVDRAVRNAIRDAHSTTIRSMTRSTTNDAPQHRLLPPAWPGLACVVLLLALPLAFGPHAVTALRYDRSAIGDGEWWRLATAHVVHFDVAHFAMNVAGLALLWWLFVRDARPAEWTVAVVASASTVSGGLWFLQPGLGWYVGASGVLHGLWAAAAVAAWRRWPLESGVTLALLAAKLALEQARGALSTELGAALPVVVDAHLYGAAGGLAAALALRLWRQRL
jgi:rhomboid family GlyGly-CTERM serine protease